MPQRSQASPKRYAQALFQLGRSSENLDEWRENLERLAEVVGNQEALGLLEAPGIKLQDKLAMLKEALPQVMPLAHNLAAQLVQRRAVGIVPQVLEEFQRALDTHQGLQRAEVVTAVPLLDAERNRIAARLAASFGTEVEVAARVDPSLLGGLMVRVGDRVLDGTSRGRLEAMRQSLGEAAF